jgi:hypothetical protein
MKPIINILIRHSSGREVSYYRALSSVFAQTYKEVKIIVGYDFCSSHFAIPGSVFDVFLKADKSLGPFFYNDYCNTLKNHVSEGWFLFLDDDDYLANENVLEELSKHFHDDYHAIVCQMSRDSGKIKPSDDLISSGQVVSGRIGLPCLVLRSKLNYIANVPATENGDFLWIKEVTDKVPTKFINQVVVHSPQRNFGK